MTTLTILKSKKQKIIDRLDTNPDALLSMVFKLILMFIVFGLNSPVMCQEVWNLPMCIDYAIEHNIELNQKALEVQTQKVNMLENTAGLLPGLNMGTYATLYFGRNVDADNNITFNKTLTNNYWIESSVNLFNGWMQVNTISYNRYLLNASKQGYEIARNQLIMNVLSAYYTVVYSRGLLLVANEQVILSGKEVERSQQMVDLGRGSPVILQELKSNWAADKLNLAQAEGNYMGAVIAFKQLLRLNESELLLTDTLGVESLYMESLPNADSIYQQALGKLPEMKQQDFLVQAAKKDLAISRGSLSPRIYLSGGLNTGYYNSNDSTDFRKQWNNNQSEYVQVGVSIPIFNQASGCGNIKRKKILLENQKLSFEKAKEALNSQIIQTHQDLLSAEKEFLSSQEMLTYSELSYKQMAKKLEDGSASPTEYSAAKQKVLSAKANLLKSKLLYGMYRQMLEFYMRGDWEHLKVAG